MTLCSVGNILRIEQFKEAVSKSIWKAKIKTMLKHSGTHRSPRRIRRSIMLSKRSVSGVSVLKFGILSRLVQLFQSGEVSI